MELRFFALDVCMYLCLKTKAEVLQMCTDTRHVQPCCCVHQSQDLFAGKTPENGMARLVCMMQGEHECPETEEDEEQGQE
jgi:hypothetical protein